MTFGQQAHSEAGRLSPLEGISVLEFGGIAAAYAAKMLADFGADVLTLEPADGDPMRSRQPHVPDKDGAGPGAMYRYLRTNRRVLRAPIEPADLAELLARAQFFVTDAPDEQRATIGLGTTTLRHAHPHLVIVTISPFGSIGPRGAERGGELVMFAEGGLAQTSPGLPDGVSDLYMEGPLHPGGYPASIIAGLTAAVAALTALPYRADSVRPPGDHIDVSGQAAVASMTSRYLAVTSYEGVVTDRFYPGPLNMPNLYVPCKDGYVVIAAILDNQWHRLVEALGSPDWALDPSFARAAGRNAGQATIESRLREWCLSLSGDEIVERATKHGVPCFRFFRLDEMESSEHVVARASLVDVPGSEDRTMPGAPFLMSRSLWRLPQAAPSTLSTVADVISSPAWIGTLGEDDVPATKAPTRPLEGIRVLDFGQVLAVPFGTQWMAWLGADVILVESAAHLHTRATPPFATSDRNPDSSAVFNFFNGGKRSLTVDMKSEEGRQVLLDLVPHCDVVTENFRAGVLDRLGLSYERLKELRSDIIVLSLGAFGRSGPMADAAGLHSAANLFSGLADVTRYPGGGPRIMGSVLPDPLSGLNGLLAIFLALQHRRRTGEGQIIDQAMYESLLPLCAGALMASETDRAQMRAVGSQGSDAYFSGMFPARDPGGWLALELTDEHEWLALLDEVGLRALGASADVHDGLVLARARAAIVHWLGERSLEEGIQRLRSRGIVAGRAATTSDTLQDEHLRAIGYLREIDHPVAGPRWIPTLPWRTADSDALNFGRPPLLGEDVEPILADLLGYDADRIARLRELGALK